MSYPPYLARITHFQLDANSGLDSPSPSGLDSELDAILESSNQLNLQVRRVTTADGKLKNLTSAQAQALAGMAAFTATASQTAFDTIIPWSAAFSSSSVMVYVNNVKLASTAVTVSDNAGDLRVTLAAQAAGNTVEVWAFEPGAGILARIQTISATDGANLVAIEDAGGYTTVVTVEDALQELYSHTQSASGKAWLEGVLVKSDYVLKAGSTMATNANLTFQGTGTVKGLPASAANGDAVRHEQVIALQTSITGITATFMPKSGGTFTGPVDFNSQVVDGVPTPAAADHAANKGYVDTTLASFGGLPVGTMIDYAAASPPTGWLLCDGAHVSRATYASLFAVIGVTWGVGDGSTTFALPDLRGRATIGAGTGPTLTTRLLAATGGAETHQLTIPELPSHTHPNTTPALLQDSDSGGDSHYYGALGNSGATGSDSPHNNMQPFAVATKIIKY